jgi:hypothetical protein
MADARDELKREQGLRTLVVLTDGQDNRFQTDMKLNPKKLPFQELLGQLFLGTAIDIHVVGFQVRPEEAESARQQFAALRQLDPPGTYSVADQLPELTAAIRRAMRPELRYQIETADRLPVAGTLPEGNPAGTGPGLDRWLQPGLEPGVYQIRLTRQTTGEKPIALQPADRLILGIQGIGDRFRWERRLASDDRPGLFNQTANGWRFSLAQWQSRTQGALGRIWMERPFDPLEATLQLPRPRFAYAELVGQGTASQRWRTDDSYAAETWVVEARQPTNRLRAWWVADREPTVAARIIPETHFQSWGDLQGMTFAVDGDPVRIEQCSTGIYRTAGVDAADVTGRGLALRFTHDVSNPVWVRLRDRALANVTHRTYPNEGCTTVIVWPWTDDRLAEFELISLRAEERSARQRGDWMEWQDWPQPDPVSSAPPRPDF